MCAQSLHTYHLSQQQNEGHMICDAMVTNGALPGMRRIQGETVEWRDGLVAYLTVDSSKFRTNDEEVAAITQVYEELTAGL